MTPDENYMEVRECDYKGEHYSVRDNGAIFRHSKGRKRPSDEKWTFGTPNEKRYMIFAGEQVHRIVATAFCGEAPSIQHVVDHIDTNHSNNRPENLRWLTKLENALNNPATLKKITYLCGGDIQKFLDDPSCLRDLTRTNQDVMWMRTVSSDEAKNAFAKIMSWAAKPSDETPSKGGKMGEWLYSQDFDDWRPHRRHDRSNSPSSLPEKPAESLTVNDLRLANGKPLQTAEPYFDRPMQYDGWGNPIGPKPTRQEKKDLEENHVSRYFETSNKLAQQLGWKPYTNPEFPCCPKQVSDNPLQEYFNNLEKGAVFVNASYGASTVYEYTIHDDQLLVLTRIPGLKRFALARVTWNGKVFVHESIGTYFQENGALAAFTRAQGKDWTGPESIDDYC